ncbi:MAG: glycosyltransferase family 1 protein [Synergistaceae bacterium]|nr:glycosyltransferase family 1 protein [Synergistaceae bacterium]
MKICIATDAWTPQVNGVVRTLSETRRRLRKMGHEVFLLSPDRFATVPCPTYREIRLAWNLWDIDRFLRDFQPDAIHIATEGPIGISTRAWCLRENFPFTTSFTTRFPEYIRSRCGLPSELIYEALRRFHLPSSAVMVATASLHEELQKRGFANLVRWSRGVDTALFRPADAPQATRTRPVFLYVGRVAVEKNIPAFLDLDLPGTKRVVGSGPDLEALRRAWPSVEVSGALEGIDLSRAYAEADVFVFPSRTDTFGIVMLESLACGTPVAAFPVTGPRDILRQGVTGIMDEDLRKACLLALRLDRSACRADALNWSWENCTRQFLENLRPQGFPRAVHDPDGGL